MIASGREARWNLKGERVIYTSASRSLACLENLVHSGGETLWEQYRVMVIYIPDRIHIYTFDPGVLPEDWNQFPRPRICQLMGSKWIKEGQYGVLKVPSAIVKEEYNYLLNPGHSLFKEIQLVDTEAFPFDHRLSKKF